VTTVLKPMPHSPRPEWPKGRLPIWGRLVLGLTALLTSASAVWAYPPDKPRRPGQILIVRGLLTVFSMGLDDLGNELRVEGFDVSVEFASLSPLAVERMKARYGESGAPGPVVIIGHSLGAYMAPGLARQLGDAGIPVDLMVMLDCLHDATIPANVRRCVNLYQAAKHGFVEALPVKAESSATTLFNIEVNKYQEHLSKRPPEVLAQLQFRHFNVNESIDHFNIDDSKWIHEIVIREVLHVCSQPRQGR
jgi:hypothetical protein